MNKKNNFLSFPRQDGKSSKEMFDKLIGAQVLTLNEDKIVVKDKNGETFDISFEVDDCECCEFKDITKELFFEPNDKNNPIITNWEWEEQESGSQTVILTLYGLQKLLAEYEFECGSSSGWCYGATITAMCCLENKIQETEICKW